jgi:hypothetical protein
MFFLLLLFCIDHAMLLSVPAPNVERFDTEIPVWALDLLETLFFSLQLLMCEL